METNQYQFFFFALEALKLDEVSTLGARGFKRPPCVAGDGGHTRLGPALTVAEPGEIFVVWGAKGRRSVGSGGTVPCHPRGVGAHVRQGRELRAAFRSRAPRCRVPVPASGKAQPWHRGDRSSGPPHPTRRSPPGTAAWPMTALRRPRGPAFLPEVLSRRRVPPAAPVAPGAQASAHPLATTPLVFGDLDRSQRRGFPGTPARSRGACP